MGATLSRTGTPHKAQPNPAVWMDCPGRIAHCQSHSKNNIDSDRVPGLSRLGSGTRAKKGYGTRELDCHKRWRGNLSGRGLVTPQRHVLAQWHQISSGYSTRLLLLIFMAFKAKRRWLVSSGISSDWHSLHCNLTFYLCHSQSHS
jgi:hypothetical protein